MQHSLYPFDVLEGHAHVYARSSPYVAMTDRPSLHSWLRRALSPRGRMRSRNTDATKPQARRSHLGVDAGVPPSPEVNTFLFSYSQGVSSASHDDCFVNRQTGHYSKLRIVGGNIDISTSNPSADGNFEHSTSNIQHPTFNGR